MIYWWEILNLCQKEFLVILKDRSSRIILFVPVVLQSFLFGYAATFDLEDVPYVVVDQSHSQVSQDILARLDGAGVFRLQANLGSMPEAQPLVDNGKALLIVHFPSNFADELAHNGSAALQLIVDGRNSASANSAVAYISQIVASYNQTHLELSPPVVVDSRIWFNPNTITRWTIVPALIAALSMIQTMMLTALSVAREREQGTFDQLLVTPMGTGQILVGKSVPPIVIGLIQSTLVLWVSLFWFSIPMAGGLIALYSGLLMFTLASVGLGLSIAAISNSMQQGMLYTFVLIMPLMLLSGFATPIQNMPDLMQWATYANPLRFSVHLVREVYMKGAGLSDVWPDLVALGLIAAITLPLAAWLFRHRSQ